MSKAIELLDETELQRVYKMDQKALRYHFRKGHLPGVIEVGKILRGHPDVVFEHIHRQATRSRAGVNAAA